MNTTPDPLEILFPNGRAEASAVYIWDTNTLSLVLWDGSLTTGSVTIGSVTIDGQPILVTFTNSSIAITAASLPLPTNAAKETGGNLADILAKLNASIAVTGPLTDTQLRATPVPVSGTIAVTQSTSPWAAKELRAATTSVTSVSGTTTSTTIVASNANRLSYSVFNNSSASLYLRKGSGAASSSDFSVKLLPGGYYENDEYTGDIKGIWDTANGAALVTEAT